MAAIQQPVYGASGCHTGLSEFVVTRGWCQQDGNVTVSDAAIIASLAYAARTTFLNNLQSLGMITAFADLEEMALATYTSSPVDFAFTGGYSATMTGKGRHYLTPADTVDTGINYRVRIDQNAAGIHGRQNYSPLPGFRHVNFALNAAEFTFSDQPKAFGFWVGDLQEDFVTGLPQGPNPALHYAKLIVTTNVTTFIFEPGNQIPAGDPLDLNDPNQRPICVWNYIEFLSVVVPSGQYITKVVLRWGYYSTSTSLRNYVGFDGFICAKCS